MTENGGTYFTRASAVFLQRIIESLFVACATEEAFVLISLSAHGSC